MKNLKIIGAGFAGLIAGHLLRRHQPIIMEAAKTVPLNHSALLRFRTDRVATATSIPFARVHVRKGVKARHGNEIKSLSAIPDINAYSRKVSGVVSERSISDLTPCDRWVAPDNFHELLVKSCPAQIMLDQMLTSLDIAAKDKNDIWISTLPMPVMMNLVGWANETPQFEHRAITTLVADIKAPLTTVYQTVYLPYAENVGQFYRASIHGNQLIVEGVGDYVGQDGYMTGLTDQQICRHMLQELFGIDNPIIHEVRRKVQKYGKMVPVAAHIRQAFLLHLTHEYNIYSLGRYATWRPILLDDVVHDVSVIERLAQNPYHTNPLS